MKNCFNRESGLFFIAGTLAFFPLLLVFVIGFQATLDDWDQVFYLPTFIALRNSLSIFFCQGLLVFPLALTIGVMSALFEFPLRRLSLMLSFFPLILPSFITAIGIQSLNIFLPYEHMDWVDGVYGSVWTLAVVVFPLATLGTYFTVKSIARSELETLYQVGGKRLLLKHAMRRAAPATFVCIGVAGLVGLSDFGISNIMGFHGLASEIQISFAAKFNFALAAAKAMFLLVVLVPVFYLIYRWFPKRVSASRNLSQASQPIELSFWLGCFWSLLQLLVCIIGSAAMLVGLLQPLLRAHSTVYLQQVWARYVDSLGLTLLYGMGSSVIATAIGFTLCSYFFGQSNHKQRTLMVVLLAFTFVLPSGITALGITWLGAHLPHWLDGVFRSDGVVMLTMGIRFAPVAALVYFLGYALLPAGLGDVHLCLRPNWVFSKIQLQFFTLWKWGALSFVLISILTLADVGAIRLVQPPTSDSFGSYFFASMDNSPEVLVSSMCLVYMSTPLAIVVASGCIYALYYAAYFMLHKTRHDRSCKYS